MADTFEKFNEILGFDGSKKLSITQEVFSEALAEIKEERNKDAKVKAKEVLLKGLQLQETLVKLKKEFDTKYNKEMKELNKIINTISGMKNGQSAEETAKEDVSKEEVV